MAYGILPMMMTTSTIAQSSAPSPAAGSGLGATAIGAAAVSGVVASLLSADFAAKQAKFSAKLAAEQAEMAIQSGLSNATKQLSEGRRIKSTQRAQIAGAGLDVNVGTPAQLQQETDVIAADNARRTIMSASLSAYGYQMQAGQSNLQASIERSRGISDAAGVALSSIGQFVERNERRTTILNRKA